VTERTGLHRPMLAGRFTVAAMARLARVTQGERFSRCEINGLR
jgi:hypothetical protein